MPEPTIFEIRQRLTGVKADLVAALSLLLEQNGGIIEVQDRPVLVLYPDNTPAFSEMVRVRMHDGSVVVDTMGWTNVVVDRIPSPSLLHVLEAANKEAKHPLA